MSNSSARRPQPASSGAQLSSASSASSRDEITPISSPVSRFTRARNAPPLAARRHASVAIARRQRTGRRSSRAAQACSADRARSIAAGQSWPVRCSPSPSRTMRLKLSSTRNPSPDGAATSMRQLLVPRSSAANVAPANRRGSAGSAPGSTGDWTFRGCITALSSRTCLTGQASSGRVATISSGHRPAGCQGDRSWTQRPTPLRA